MAEGGGILLISDVIRNLLGIPCAILMGANIANEVALENYCEATVGKCVGCGWVSGYIFRKAHLTTHKKRGEKSKVCLLM